MYVRVQECACVLCGNGTQHAVCPRSTHSGGRVPPPGDEDVDGGVDGHCVHRTEVPVVVANDLDTSNSNIRSNGNSTTRTE